MATKKDIFERMQIGEIISFDDPEYSKIMEAVSLTKKFVVELNNATEDEKIRELLSKIIGAEIDKTTTVFTPFHTNFGRYIKFGKNIFINHDCTFLDLGSITIEDDVMIAPKVSLITESHPTAPSERKALLLKPILIKRNAWIGASATILPGVTIGENSVVAAGSVVTKDVPDNTVVAGIPAKIIKNLSGLMDEVN
ncbi:sugar O-acetyltransferase [Emticicia sp. SJ17W-69]|uniref:sugar O-acetyltransferase n=1 Tax=Emticicia sp. SJ17W-69 TaxID=3421657 RepID=UPI003EB94B30